MGGAPGTEFLMSKISVLYYVFFINGTHTVLYDFSHGTHTTNHSSCVRASVGVWVKGHIVLIVVPWLERQRMSQSVVGVMDEGWMAWKGLVKERLQQIV